MGISAKSGSAGNPLKYDARSVAKGVSRKGGIYYEEFFELTSRYATICFILALKVLNKNQLLQLNVKNAFRNGDLKGEIYIEILDGDQVHYNNEDCQRLHTALYGLRQAAWVWYEKQDCRLAMIALKRPGEGASYYYLTKACDPTFLRVLVEDIILFGSSKELVNMLTKGITEHVDLRAERNIERFLWSSFNDWRTRNFDK